MSHSKNFKAIIITASLVFSAQLSAGGFQLWEESAASLGDYHAGAAAEADDASSIFYNPAGMARMDHQQLSLGAAIINLEANYNGAVLFNGNPTFQIDQTGPGGQSGDTFNIVPNFHYVRPINDHWAVGFEETTPFGLSTSYCSTAQQDSDCNYVASLATDTELHTINLNPSVSYRVNHYFSMALGFDALYGQAEYDNAFSTGPIKNKLSGTGYGYNAGVLFEFTPQTRVGLSYRSPITVSASGTSNFDASTPTSSTVSADFPLPATSMLSLYHDVTDRFAVMASAFYTQWSCFNQLILQGIAQPTGTAPATLVINENYKNTWNFAVGSRYWFNPHIGMEAGFGHDDTPTQLPMRDIRLPDASRYVASVGLNFRPTKDFQWSMGWTHLFAAGATPVDNSGSYNPSGTTLDPSDYNISQGSVTADVNVVGLQMTWNI